MTDQGTLYAVPSRLRVRLLWIYLLLGGCSTPPTTPFRSDWEYVRAEETRTGRERYVVAMTEPPERVGNTIAVRGSLSNEYELILRHYYRLVEEYYIGLKTILGDPTVKKSTEYSDPPLNPGQSITIPPEVRRTTEPEWKRGSLPKTNLPDIRWSVVELAESDRHPSAGNVQPQQDGSFVVVLSGLLLFEARRQAPTGFRLQILVDGGPPAEIDISQDLITAALNP